MHLPARRIRRDPRTRCDSSYDSYDTDEQTGTEDGIYVEYAREWDGYGAMFGATRFDPIDEFGGAVGEKRRQFDRINPEFATSDCNGDR